LRYQPDPGVKPAVAGDRAKESFVVKMRHKKPDGDKSTLRELPVTDPGKGYAEASEDFRFAAAVASFALLLRDSPHKGESSFALVQELAAAAKNHDPSGYRAEFLELIRQAKAISGKP
jgi:Ca-activated chloride channel family protein